jgi:hypothetical protein
VNLVYGTISSNNQLRLKFDIFTCIQAVASKGARGSDVDIAKVNFEISERWS